ncbi:MAG TPA: PA14 domain-containing protein, partial [Planctomycetota bacterium]|nr:PA14 domain-containing protein [Planctomycetota bacterium]
PPISRQDVAALPVWGQPVKPEELPASFRRRDPVRLLKPRDPENPTLPIKGLAYEYFEGTFEKLPDFGALTPARTGTCETFDLSKRGRDAAYAFRFTGYVDVPRDGVYTFTLSSNDGSKLFIGRDEVADNDHFHGVAEASGEIALKAGKHPIMVVYFQHGGNQVLEVFWEGPELPRQKIPASALFHTPAR